MAEFNNGEYIEKFLLPQILHELRNLKADFITPIPTTPKRALTSGGVVVEKIGQPIQVDWDKADAYADVDVVRFLVENKVIPWSYFSTTPFETDKEEIRESMLDRQGTLRMKSQSAIAESWIKKVLHSIAPDDDTAVELPFLETTGEDRGDGSRRLLIKDLVKFRGLYNKLPLLKLNDIHMVLTPDHLEDLMLDALNYQNFKDIYVKTAEGEPINQYGFKFYWNQEQVYYAADNTKKAQGAAILPTDRPASISFYPDHLTKAMYNITVHHKPMSEDTRNNPPKDETRFTGNALVAAIWLYGQGALKSGTV
jgi:hypothetical protein